ncbi:MAG: type II toxin-antitoxin system RelE/ParE family toxin [Bacteroidetes bacterium]|nr:type II toxin-antitoxin system RelE/ParE family toxin [Bacteroidota bacterium]
MAQRIVRWTDTAAKQRRSILQYWTARNKSTEYAEKLITQSEEKIKMISLAPESYKKADYPNTHFAVMGHFSIYFQFTDSIIFIKAFWDNRQDPKKLLKLFKENH